MKIVFSILIILFSLNVKAQKNINVACTDFTFNSKKSSDGKNIIYIFESALTKSNTLIKVLERKNLDYFLSKVEEEKNLANDFGEKTKKDLALAGVDYLVLGNILTSPGIDTATMSICFTKISGKDVTTKHTISIFVHKEDLNNFEFLENKITEKLKVIPFVEKLGIIEKDQMEEINKQFKEKDERIKELEIIENNRKTKENEIKKMKSTTPDISFEFFYSKDSFVCVLVWQNFIPTKFELNVKYVDNNKQLGNFIILKNEETFYPNNSNRTFTYGYCGISQCDFLNKDVVKLRVEVKYRSIYYEEMQYKPELSKVISKIYTYDTKSHELVLTEN